MFFFVLIVLQVCVYVCPFGSWSKKVTPKVKPCVCLSVCVCVYLLAIREKSMSTTGKLYDMYAYVYILYNTRIHKIPNTEPARMCRLWPWDLSPRRVFARWNLPRAYLRLLLYYSRLILYVNACVCTLILCQVFSLFYLHSFGGTHPRASVPIFQEPIIIISFTVSVASSLAHFRLYYTAVQCSKYLYY